MTITYYTDEDGHRHATLPAKWKNCVCTSWDYLQDIGWTEHEEEVPELTPVIRYSKYRIQLACQQRGLWDRVKAAIADAGMQDSWANIIDISSDNPELLSALPGIKAAFGDDTVTQVLGESILE